MHMHIWVYSIVELDLQKKNIFRIHIKFKKKCMSLLNMMKFFKLITCEAFKTIFALTFNPTIKKLKRIMSCFKVCVCAVLKIH